MKSGKQRRAEIRAARLARATKNPARNTVNLYWDQEKGAWPDPGPTPKGAVRADPNRLTHDNTYSPRPAFYFDRSFICADCGTHELWTAKQQKWWYEIAQGKIASRAKYCRPCRKKRREVKGAARTEHISGLIEKLGLEQAAQRLQLPVEEIQRYEVKREDSGN